MQHPRALKPSLIFYDVLIPTLIALLIIGSAMASSPALLGIKYSLLEAILVVGIPMLMGLIWNKWAGGATGFLLGSLYALYYADQLYASQGRTDITLVGNLASAMLIGYIAGALNQRSNNYRRMMLSGVAAGFMGALVVIFAGQFSSVLGESTIGGAALAFLPRILSGVIVPLVAKAFLWHNANKKAMQ
ncbi:MAG: hypothetical protein ACPLIG_02910 [Candidatus Bathyarchaeales archaeon]